MPQLNHLNLNYCKKLTDVSINAIAQSMGMIFSLDLGFCTNISETALCTLLETRGDVLSELRLRWCWTLDLGTQPGVPATRGVHRAGWQMLNAIAVSGMNSRLSILDVRHCKSRVGPHEAFPETDSFVQRMKSLGFDQKIPGFFVRPTRWNETVEQLLIDQFLI